MGWTLGIVIVLLVLAVFHLDSNFTKVRSKLEELESRITEIEDEDSNKSE